MRSAGRIILAGSYSITAPVEEQIMLFSSLVLTEQVCFHQLNFNMFFLLLETYFLWGKWLKSRSGCSIESCLVWCHISSGSALWSQEENSLCLCFFSSVGLHALVKPQIRLYTSRGYIKSVQHWTTSSVLFVNSSRLHCTISSNHQKLWDIKMVITCVEC